MTPLTSAAVALCLCGLQIASADDLKTCGFSTIAGVIRSDLSHKNIKALSFLDCTISSCGCNARCAGSFNKKTGACVTSTLSAAPLAWTKELLFSSSSDKDWVSFAPSASLVSLAPSAGLWLMDSSFRGRNLGYKGPLLDSSDTGLEWSSEGPLGSALKYARFAGSHSPRIQVRHSDSFLLDFTKPFSVAFWVKTDDRTAIEPLLDGRNTEGNTHAVHIWFYDSSNLDQLYLIGNHQVFSAINGINKLMWRHIAMVYKGADEYSFYLNATAWPILQKTVGGLPRINPDFINIGHRDSSVFKGAMACISIFERGLTAEEVRGWMSICP